MNKVPRWQSYLFIVGLSFIAIIIHSIPRNDRDTGATDLHRSATQHTTSSARSQSYQYSVTDSQKTENERPEQKYLTSPIRKQIGVTNVGIAVLAENGTLNVRLANALASGIESKATKALPGLFTPLAASDKFVNALFSESLAMPDRSWLFDHIDTLLLGRQAVTYSTNRNLENTVTANMQIQIRILGPGDQHVDEQVFLATGAGFIPASARKMAEERMLTQLAAWANQLAGAVRSSQ